MSILVIQKVYVRRQQYMWINLESSEWLQRLRYSSGREDEGWMPYHKKENKVDDFKLIIKAILLHFTSNSKDKQRMKHQNRTWRWKNKKTLFLKKAMTLMCPYSYLWKTSIARWHGEDAGKIHRQTYGETLWNISGLPGRLKVVIKAEQVFLSSLIVMSCWMRTAPAHPAPSRASIDLYGVRIQLMLANYIWLRKPPWNIQFKIRPEK